MNTAELKPATQPTFYFVGVTTGKSSIMNIFPRWMKHLGLGDVAICGVDCKLHDDPCVYRSIVEFIKRDPLSRGGLVTTHKIDLLKASADLFEELGPHARLLGEVSSISKRSGKLIGHAVDAVTAGLSLQAIIPPGYWRETGADLCLLGAGGSSRALALYMLQTQPAADRPSRICITNRGLPNLEATKAILDGLKPEIRIEYTHAPEHAANDAVVGGLKPGSIIGNATGLGKDAPGSPLTAAAVFPLAGIAWDFNYRGELVFLDQARAQQQARNLRIEDGWVYFLHGWTQVIAEVFDIKIPSSGPEFDALSEIAAGARTVHR